MWEKKIGVLYQQCLINYKSIIDGEIGLLTAKLVEKNKFMDGPPNLDQLAKPIWLHSISKKFFFYTKNFYSIVPFGTIYLGVYIIYYRV